MLQHFIIIAVTKRTISLQTGHNINKICEIAIRPIIQIHKHGLHYYRISIDVNIMYNVLLIARHYHQCTDTAGRVLGKGGTSMNQMGFVLAFHEGVD